MPHNQFVVTPRRKSEIEQLSIQREVLSLLEKKVLQEVPQQEETRGFYSPLFLRTKPDGTFRVIINLKQLNRYLVIEKFKMETIKSCVRSLIPSCFMTVIDLKDAYYHVPIHPDFRKYLRVAVMIQGELKHYQYKALPFGLAIAPRVFTKLMAEVMAHIREQNILIVPYLDDLLVMGSSSLHCSQQLNRVMVALSNLGWFLNLEKSRLIPSQVQLYLGILIDSTKQECRLPEEKVSNMIHLGPENDYFHMNPLNGEITLAKVLEYNMINRFELYAGAEDPSGHFNVVPVIIDIQDVDTMNPHFIFPLYEGSISENQTGRISTHPEAIKAVDGDLGINETVYYSIRKVYPTEFAKFISIDHSDGIISVNKEIDRETVSLITVEIKATQQNNQLKSADSVVMITILDENDNTPQFSQSTYEASLPENSPSGSIILVLRVTDKDQDGLSNGYFRTNNTMFKVDKNGVMYFNHGELDREATPRINVQVWVFDALFGGLNSSAKVIITITDVNDNNPEFNNLPLRYTIPEGNYTDTSPVLVAKLNVTDLDAGLNGYVTVSTDAESGDKSFRVQENGNIFASGPLDREAKDKFEIVLIASDRGSPPRKSFADAVIVIQDVNDNVPTFTKEDYSADLILTKAKAGDKIMSVSATDLDIGNNSLISYRFVQPHRGFAINEENGDIFLTSPVFAISGTNIVIPVIAIDHGSPALSSTASVIINVSEGETEFVNSNYSFSLLEGMPEGTYVGSVAVTAGPDVAVMYFVQTYAKLFSITESGTIVTRAILDREEQDSYNVLVTAVDSQDPPNTAAVKVIIAIMDVNDNSPVFSPIINLNVTCLENKNFLDLDNITATDVDVGKNGAITYSLENDFDSTFYINSSTGQLMNIKPLDAESTDNYDLKVIVSTNSLEVSCVHASREGQCYKWLNNGNLCCVYEA
ncbi:unnamed protein product [Ranitomeya imitator]|uniref:ribonuclease H n=1 Tax=Ranitomeya imitator TaxID=111125 RepID=A0ABN9L964_9NEOB|nr:unnamed protein product [Ranitomeya imitator]